MTGLSRLTIVFRIDDVLCIRVDGPGELLGTVGLVKNVVGQGLQVSQVCAAAVRQYYPAKLIFLLTSRVHPASG